MESQALLESMLRSVAALEFEVLIHPAESECINCTIEEIIFNALYLKNQASSLLVT